MKWQCALLQRWLPEYPDGDLPGWGKRWLKAHVAQCAACRQELAVLRQLVTTIQAAPVKDPGMEFWSDFSRDVHLKLVQAAQETKPAPSTPWRLKLPYLLGAPALAVLLVWVAVHLTGPGVPVQNQAMIKRETAPKMAEVAKRAPAPPMARVAEKVVELDQFVPVALEEGAALPVEEVDISGWDLDSELAGMTDQEKEKFLNKLDQRKKDGSWAEKFSLCSWG